MVHRLLSRWHGLLMRTPENRSKNSVAGEGFAQRFSAAKIWIVFPLHSRRA